jgi:hypothetical protein
VTDPVGESADRIYHDASGLVGEGHAPQGGEAALKKGINCATARQDIEALKSEKAGVGQQIMAGVSSVLPVSAVVGLLKGNYSENVQVSAGQYNADIDRKISEIRTVCGDSYYIRLCRESALPPIYPSVVRSKTRVVEC